jgi:hypothetical protein
MCGVADGEAREKRAIHALLIPISAGVSLQMCISYYGRMKPILSIFWKLILHSTISLFCMEVIEGVS